MRKKGFLIATSAGFAAAMPGAQAADMPIKAPRYLEPAAASWAGWYIGAHAGAVWQNTQTDTLGGVGGKSFPFSLGSTSASNTGFIGGGQIGYNWQRGNFVFGLEADISGLTSKTSAGLLFYETTTLESKIRWLSTVRTRFGLAVGDTMAYMTAGVAFGGVKNSINNFDDIPGANYSASKTKVGWTVGGGVEHMLNRNWTIGLEGLFVDLGKSTVTGGTKTTRFSNQAVIGRLKLNYKF